MALISLALMFGLTQNAWAIRGKITIVNKSGYMVEILVEKRNNSGLPYWKPIATVKKRNKRIFRKIPSGTKFGFREIKKIKGKPKTWPPHKFIFSKGRDQLTWTLRN